MGSQLQRERALTRDQQARVEELAERLMEAEERVKNLRTEHQRKQDLSSRKTLHEEYKACVRLKQ